jgi:hypothetical protein
MKLNVPSFSSLSSGGGAPSNSNSPAQLAVRGLHKARSKAKAEDFTRYQTNLIGYANEKLGLELWAGVNAKKGQLEIARDIEASVTAQLAGEPATKVFHVEAGHGLGKTFFGAILVNWFFDAFAPSVTMTTAPSIDQVELLLWKNIKSQREGKGLPGRVLPDAPKMTKAANWLAYGRTTSDSGGQGTSRIQGQHDEYLLFILDEAEGIPAFVFSAVDAMMTGGRVVICLMIANPQTRSSAFHKKGKERGVATYRLSLLDFPNVVLDAPIVKGGTTREWVNAKIAKHCDVVQAHSEDEHTFEVGWDVEGRDGGILPAGTVFLPDAEFMFRVMGVAPKNISAKTLVTVGRYEAATTREPSEALRSSTNVRYGIDAARDGDDFATIWRLWRGVAQRIARLPKSDNTDFIGILKDDFVRVKADGATSCHVRVDGGGGFGSGVIDFLPNDEGLVGMFADLQVFEVHNNANPHDQKAYADLVTEMYAEAAETLKGIRLHAPPIELEADLTERQYGWKNKSAVWVKKLEAKDKFKDRVNRSPDDGDGFVLAVAPDFLFKGSVKKDPIIHQVGESVVSIGSMVGLGGMTGSGGLGGMMR